MSYNGTVFCRDCGGKGHNKRTCPELTSYLKRMAEINPDSYEAAQYRKRVGIDRDGNKVKKPKATRRCKWCGTKGHNARTCESLTKAKKDKIFNEQVFRRGLMERMTILGFGVGALTQTNRWGDKYTWLVTGVDWNSVTSYNVDSSCPVAVSGVGTTTKTYHYLPREKMDDYGYVGEVLSPVEPIFPSNFLDEAVVGKRVQEFFDSNPDMKSTDYWDNFYNN